MTNWIKFSERQPTEKDLPIEVGNHERKSHRSNVPTQADISGCEFTHWRSFPSDLPPVENPDEAAFKAASKGYDFASGFQRRAAHYFWLAALDWERSRNPNQDARSGFRERIAGVVLNRHEKILAEEWFISGFNAALQRGRTQ